ncbi:YccF domain-containing protein [Vallitaleaceae bacterium 9-2]
MKVLGNIIWWLFGGVILAGIWFLGGLLLTITIIGIPFGIQCFKIAGFVLFPFGRNIELGHFGAGGLLLNVLWAIFIGWELAIGHLFAALLSAITLIGIPFAKQHFKLAQLAFIPFGARVG